MSRRPRPRHPRLRRPRSSFLPPPLCASRTPRGRLLRLADGVVAVDGQRRKCFDPAERPADLDPVHDGRSAQPEVQPRIARGVVRRSGMDLSRLTEPPARDGDARADRPAIAAGPDEAEPDPVAAVAAVVVQVAEGAATCAVKLIESGARFTRRLPESSVSLVVEELVVLEKGGPEVECVDAGVDVPVRDEDVVPPVVVVVEEADPP